MNKRLLLLIIFPILTITAIGIIANIYWPKFDNELEQHFDKPIVNETEVGQIKALIPESASITAEEFEMNFKKKDRTDTNYVQLKGTPLTLLILLLPRYTEGKPRRGHNIETFSDVLFPQNSGYASIIHHDYITNFTCKINDDSATGTVAFEAPDIYKGQVNYVARKHNGKWRIEEFHLPNSGISTILQNDGTWR